MNCNDNGGFCFELRRLVQNPEILREFEHFLCKAAEFGSNWRENNGNPSEIRRVYVDLCKICMIPLARSIGCSALRFPVSVCEKWRKSGRFALFLRFRCAAARKSHLIAYFSCVRARRKLLAAPHPSNRGLPDFPVCASLRIAAGNLENPHWGARKPRSFAQFPRARARRKLPVAPHLTNRGLPDFPACARPCIAVGNPENSHGVRKNCVQSSNSRAFAHGGDYQPRCA